MVKKRIAASIMALGIMAAGAAGLSPELTPSLGNGSALVASAANSNFKIVSAKKTKIHFAVYAHAANAKTITVSVGGTPKKLTLKDNNGFTRMYKGSITFTAISPNGQGHIEYTEPLYYIEVVNKNVKNYTTEYYNDLNAVASCYKANNKTYNVFCFSATIQNNKKNITRVFGTNDRSYVYNS